MSVEANLVSTYFDAMAFLMLLGLLLLSSRIKMNKLEGKLFAIMCGLTMCSALFGDMFEMIHFPVYSDVNIIGLIAKTVKEVAEIHFVLTWVLYIDYKIYNSKARLYEKYTIIGIPVLVYDFLLAINPIAGTMMTYSTVSGYEYTWSYMTLQWAKFVYLLLPVVIAVLYTRRNGRLIFLQLHTLYVPVFFGVLIAVFSEYNTETLGSAVGLMNLYFSLMDYWQYEDDAIGIKKREYIHRFQIFAKEGNLKFHSALKMKIDTNERDFVEILKSTFPNEKELVQNKKCEIVLFSINRRQTAIDIMADEISIAVEKYNKMHSDAKIQLSTSTWVEKDEDDALTYINSLLRG